MESTETFPDAVLQPPTGPAISYLSSSNNKSKLLLSGSYTNTLLLSFSSLNTLDLLMSCPATNQSSLFSPVVPNGKKVGS